MSYLVPIHGFINGTGKFPIQKCAIFCKFKEIKELRGGVLLYAAQAIPPIDTEIAEKGHLWMETISTRHATEANAPIAAQHGLSTDDKPRIEQVGPIVFQRFAGFVIE